MPPAANALSGPPLAGSGLVYPSGAPIPARGAARARSGLRASLGGGSGGGYGQGNLNGYGGYGSTLPYDAAAWSSTEMGDWLPIVRSPDGEININRDRMVARQRDLVRNEGFAAGLIGRILDSTIGGAYRMVSKPDYQALAARFGGKFDHVWAREFSRAASARWRAYADDPGHYNDVSRQMSVTQQLRLGLGHKLIDGENLIVRHWLPERIGYGAARYASAALVTDPDLLSNPYQAPDSRFMRAGVELDRYGVPFRYHFRKAHQNDYYAALEAQQWEAVDREDDDGFLRVIHDYDRGRAGQSRGVSIFAPVLSRMKMLARYYGLKLQAESLATVFGMAITSPYDRQMIEQALDDNAGEEIGVYADMREGWHQRNAMQLESVRMAQLAPGESIETIASERPPGEMTPFAHEMLRSLGAAAGVSGEQITGDYSEVNFSSMRVGIVNSEKTYARRVADYNANTATPLYAGWLNEAMDLGEFDDVLPRNAPDFLEAQAEYARNRWLGTARGWYDPVGERQGTVLGLDAGLDTLEDACAEQGAEWEENVQQRGLEAKAFKDAGLPPPNWFGDAASATKTATKPEKPEA
jgi:lambda family phage portal protein